MAALGTAAPAAKLRLAGTVYGTAGVQKLVTIERAA